MDSTEGLTFRSLEKRSVADQAVEAIKDMILRGDLKAGQTLPAERQLAAMLSISRPTLRAAIQALTAMNILQSRQGEGTFVRSLSPEELTSPIRFMLQVEDSAILHLFETRRVLEVGAARLAAPRITPAEVATLQELMTQAYAVIDDPETFLSVDFKIHGAIVAAVQNPIYTSLCESIAQLSMQSRRRTASDRSVREGAHRDHERIMVALAAADADGAADAMLTHLNNIEQAFRGALSNAPGTTKGGTHAGGHSET